MNTNRKKIIIIISLVLIIVVVAFIGIFVGKNKDEDKAVDYYGYMINPRDNKCFLITFQLIKGQLGEDLTCITDNTLLYTDETLYKEIIGKMTTNNLSTSDVDKLSKVFAENQGIKLNFTEKNIKLDIFAFVTDYKQVEDSINLRFKFTGKMDKEDVNGKLFLEFVFEQDTPSQEVKFGHR